MQIDQFTPHAPFAPFAPFLDSLFYENRFKAFGDNLREYTIEASSHVYKIIVHCELVNMQMKYTIVGWTGIETE